MAMNLGKKGVKSDINITPYIDILLVLLIIFMVAAPLKKHEQEVKVPKPAPQVQQQDAKPDIIIIDVDLDRTIRINQKPVAMEQLHYTLQEIFRRRANKNLFIRGDGDLSYGDVFKVLDIAKNSGVGDIALLNKSDGKSGSSAPPAPPPGGSRGGD